MTEVLPSSRLRLDPLMSVIRDGEEACQLVTSERHLFRIQGKTVPLLVDHVIPLLDGTRTVAELRLALASQVTEKLLDDLLQLLLRNRVIRDVTDVPPVLETDGATWPGVFHVLSRFSEHPEQLFGQLRKARVAIVGDSPLVLDLVGALGACAIGEIAVVTRQSLQIQTPPATQLHMSPWEALDAVVERTDLAFGLQDGDFDAMSEMKALNLACLRHRRSWLHVRLTIDAEAWLGPLHGPGGACFECLSLRIQNNLKAAREHAIVQQRAQQGLMPPRRLEFAPFRSQLAAMAAMEAIKYLTGVELSQLFSRCCLVDLLSQAASLHTVLRHPGCLACGPATHGRIYPWDADEVLLERTLIPEREGSSS